MAYDPLKTTMVESALEELGSKATLARLGYTDKSAEFNAVAEGQTVRFTYLEAPRVFRNYTASDSLGGATPQSYTQREMKVQKTFMSRYHVDDGEDADTLRGRAAEIGAAHGRALGREAEKYMFETLGARSRENQIKGANPFARGSDAPFDAGTNRLYAIFRMLEENFTEPDMLVGIVNPTDAEALKSNPTFSNWDQRGTQGQDTAIHGVLGRAGGFDLYSSTNIPRRASDGNMIASSARSAGQNLMSLSGFGSAGVRKGELITVGGNEYAIIRGIDPLDLGGFSSSVVALDRNLVANVTQNLAVTSKDTRDSFFFDPSTICWISRPTVDMDTDDPNIYSNVDMDSGFGVTVERQRTNGRTTYVFTMRFDCEILRDDFIVRAIGVA